VVDVHRHRGGGGGAGRERRRRAQGHLAAEQVGEQVAQLLGLRQVDGHGERASQRTPRSASSKASGVNGLAIRNAAPAEAARFRISSEPSEVTNPNATVDPDARSAERQSMSFISGMFQSERTRSGASVRVSSSA